MRKLSKEEQDIIYNNVSSMAKTFTETGGIPIPFLRLKENPYVIISARLISTKREPLYACFAVVNPKTLKPNGIFFSCEEKELSREGLEIVYVNIPGIIDFHWVMGRSTFDEVGLPLNNNENYIVGYSLTLKVDEEALKKYLSENTVYMVSKAMLTTL